MRLFLCEKLFSFCRSFFSGSPIGEMSEAGTSLSMTAIRQCANCKSRKAPDARCPFNATYGDYCSRHWKHPNRFIPKDTQRELCVTRRTVAAARRIQAAWRRAAPWLAYKRQGPAAVDRAISCNDTELYSLDSVSLIPRLYLFSMVSPQRVVWTFDIRSLCAMVMKGTLTQNPYTREPLGDRVLAKIHERIAWLRRRKYSVIHPQGSADLTAEQIWNQRVLDIFLRIESFGFHVSCDWFHGLSVTAHEDFYRTVFGLWYGRLGLTMAQREAIVPGGEAPARRLFRFMPEEGSRRSVAWWQRHNLALIEAFITRSQDKENQRLGAMYVLMGLVTVCEEAEESFPWLAAAL